MLRGVRFLHNGIEIGVKGGNTRASDLRLPVVQTKDYLYLQRGVSKLPNVVRSLPLSLEARFVRTDLLSLYLSLAGRASYQEKNIFFFFSVKSSFRNLSLIHI